ncbi:MAG: 5-(carboxyamino)imidazole ribonucleotide synthase [Balneolaceae bacterium]
MNPLRADFKLGFLGAGQLARMSALQAFRYGIQVSVFSDRPEDEPVQLMTPHSQSGSFEDPDAMVRFAKTCDLITLENEFIASDILQQVVERSGTEIYPSPGSFSLIENKWIEKQTFEKAGIPVTPYKLVNNREDLISFGDDNGWPFLLKSSKGGYDGYGNRTVATLSEAEKAYRELGGDKGHDILAEAFVEYTHELAVQVSRNSTGTSVYPCCETIQENHICVAVKSPAPIDPAHQKRAQQLAVAATEAIEGRGIYAYEFFLTSEGEILLNESAPRPHNSGHYTIEGSVTSQFENHVRSVLGLKPGSTEMRAPAVVMVNLLGTHNRPALTEASEALWNHPDAHLHIYGKLQSKVGRKMGHMTLLGEDMEELYRKGRALAADIQI